MKLIPRRITRVVRRAGVKLGLVEPWKPQKPDYRWTAHDLPWLDRPDAVQALKQARQTRRMDEQEHAWLEQWLREGFVIIPKAFPDSELDAVVEEAESFWTGKRRLPGAMLYGSRKTPDSPVTNLSQEEVLACTPEEREHLRRQRASRLCQLQFAGKASSRLANGKLLKRFTSLILNQPTPCDFFMYFERGSTATSHHDSSELYLFPPATAVGVWLALEDVSADAGPLYYFPGSHHDPMYPEFIGRYPELCLKNCPREMIDGYNIWVRELEARYERRTFLARKGDLMFFHISLLHGAEEIRNWELTRRSIVMFLIPPHVKQDQFIKSRENF